MTLLNDYMGINTYRVKAPNQVSDLATSQEREYGFGRQQQLAGQQDALQQMLMARANGQGPSVAQTQLQQGLNQAQAAARSTAAGARGMNRVAAQRAAMATGAQLAGQANEQAASLRAQEQIAGQTAAAANQNAMAGQNMALMGFGQGDQQAILNAQLTAQGANQATAQRNAENKSKTMKDFLVSGGDALSSVFSDIRAKTDIMPITAQMAAQPLPLDEPDPQPQVNGGGIAALAGGNNSVQYRPTDLPSQEEEKKGGGGALATIGSLVAMMSDLNSKTGIVPVTADTTDQRIRDLLSDDDDRGSSAEMLALLARNNEERAADLAGPKRNEIGLTLGQLANLEKRRKQWQAREFARPLISALMEQEEAQPASQLALLATPRGSKTALAPVKPYAYRYKPEAAARMGTDTGMRTGVMAQDLEKSPILDDTVIDTPNGKVIDGPRAMGASLAMLAGMDKRLKELERNSAGAR